MKKILVYALACLFSMHAMAQIRVSGKITNANDGTPIPNATIAIKGTSSGTIANEAGTYTVTVPNQNSVLVVSFTGFATKEVPVNGQTVINIALSEQVSTLSDVVVIGYGTVKKSDLTGAVASVRAEKLMDMPVPNVSQALQGKVAGVDVNINSSAPGQAAKVRIRGIGSINSNIDPLYVVDGVIGVDGNQINPNDIASVEVLKDASSTAIYGARGANGVIMITTKRGRKGSPEISYQGDVNVSTLARHLETLNSEEFVKVYNLAFENATKFDPNHGTWAPPKALNHQNFPKLFDANDKPLYNTNWEKETYKPAVSTSHQLNMQGGTDNTLYSVSLGFLDQNGLMIESWFKRYSTRITIDSDVKKWLRIGGNVNLNSAKQRVVSDANGALNVPRMVTEEVPILPVKYPDGTWAGNFDIDGLEGGPNPVHIANNRYTLNNYTSVIGDAYLLFHITPDLDFKTDFGYGLLSQKSNFYSAINLPHLSQDQGGVARVFGNSNKYWQSENYLTYNKKFNSNNSMTALLGVSFQQYKNEYWNTETQNFIDDFFQWHNLASGSVKQNSESSDYSWSMNSYFARATYNLMDKYLFTATGRVDGSSKFGKNNKYAFFPSVGAAWRIGQENFLKNSNAVNELKLRASYGVSGNQEIGQYQSIAQIRPTQVVLNGANNSGLIPGYIGNPDLKWERSLQFDAGVEWVAFDNRINLNVDFYTRTTKDLLLAAPIPWSAGFQDAFVYKNVGSVRNTGVEVNLGTTNIKTDNFTWTTNFIFTTNKNKILKLNNGNADIFPGPNFLGQTNILRVGEPIGSFYGMYRLGTYGTNEAAEAAAHNLMPGDRKYLYEAGTNNPVYGIIGQAYPKWTGTFSSTLKYKGWDFAFDIRFVQGMNTAATFKHSAEDRQTLANSLKTVLNAWTPDNQNTMIAQVRSYKFTQDSHFDTWWVEDGSYIRGQNFTLGYNFPDKFLQRSKINKLRIAASVQNLFLITDYTGYDPEVDTFNSGYGANTAFSQGIDFFPYPRPRVWNLSVNLGF
ncbi:TonB-linked outer membrane protein, SusC/RagA family [Chitinophaga terrae (ex Kim and Jung 2007)]|uniref:TonB-linked outer membrane protein, SusC/RagA family n=1 Tax=Chitinophaga terrae (ex Kim and Jung 2007) TaxID=408074 RepID=A0A1H4EZK8_9BACT|nr:TonB-dependent receptor [Chitinophaga terrae (ex Kim and Jung 2007)]MDQ0109933.1 TonB-linked SusC/RagA family outer membrane protein [Chitinophaga terrae (ex Kim and Jung 2007)]SEA90483.1 TonB-linked outer membrane protein, SusC/RagA family [Chitinophaga terrae (ex Kim and Jung 2007)]